MHGLPVTDWDAWMKKNHIRLKTAEEYVEFKRQEKYYQQAIDKMMDERRKITRAYIYGVECDK